MEFFSKLQKGKFNNKERGKYVIMSSVPALLILLGLYAVSCASCSNKLYSYFSIFVLVFSVLLSICVIYGFYLIWKFEKKGHRKWKKQ